MALFDRETDPAKERDGVPIDFGDFRVTLRRQGGANDAFEKELSKETQPYRAAIRAGMLAKSKDEEITFRVFARTCVVKWETLYSSLPKSDAFPGPDGFVEGIDMRGKLVPCTEDNLVALFKALPAVFLDLREVARGEQLFRLEQREDDAGN
jgi:hypothetical protein